METSLSSPRVGCSSSAAPLQSLRGALRVELRSLSGIVLVVQVSTRLTMQELRPGLLAWLGASPARFDVMLIDATNKLFEVQYALPFEAAQQGAVYQVLLQPLTNAFYVDALYRSAR